MTRLRLRTWTMGGLVLAIVLVVATVLFVLSRIQAQPAQGQPPFGGPGLQPPFAGPGSPAIMPPRMPMMQPAAICATDDFVYVFRGNTLYQFAAKDLRLVKKVTLEEERPLPPPDGERRPQRK